LDLIIFEAIVIREGSYGFNAHRSLLSHPAMLLDVVVAFLAVTLIVE
jgi:hypothetical protein